MLCQEALYKDSITECYEDVRGLLVETASSFYKTYGGEIEELISIANLAFVEAYRSFNPNMGAKLSTWVRFCAWNTLMNARKKHIDASRCRPEDREEKLLHSDFVELLDELDDDARQITELVFQTPNDLQVLIADAGGGVRSVKKALTAYLSKMGWERKRISKSFLKIQRAL